MLSFLWNEAGMLIHLTGQQQTSNQSISFLTSMTLNFVFCEMRINSALPTLPVAGSWEKAEAQSGECDCPKSQNRLEAQEELRPGFLTPITPASCHASTQVIETQGCASVRETLRSFFCVAAQFRKNLDVSSKPFVQKKSLITTPKFSLNCKPP